MVSWTGNTMGLYELLTELQTALQSKWKACWFLGLWIKMLQQPNAQEAFFYLGSCWCEEEASSCYYVLCLIIAQSFSVGKIEPSLTLSCITVLSIKGKKKKSPQICNALQRQWTNEHKHITVFQTQHCRIWEFVYCRCLFCGYSASKLWA